SMTKGYKATSTLRIGTTTGMGHDLPHRVQRYSVTDRKRTSASTCNGLRGGHSAPIPSLSLLSVHNIMAPATETHRYRRDVDRNGAVRADPCLAVAHDCTEDPAERHRTALDRRDPARQMESNSG